MKTSLDNIKNLKNKFVLDLSNKELTEIPIWVFQQTQLKRLLLGFNKICEIPKEIACLENLEVLDISNNKITQIQSSLCNLSKLKVLCISNNLINNIPKQVEKLSKLRTLLLNGNRIKDLPDVLVHLEKLRELNLNNNLLEFIPLVLHKMPNLKKIWINHNYIPAFNLRYFKDLKYINHVSYKVQKHKLVPCPKNEEHYVKIRRNTFIIDTDSTNDGNQGTCFYLKNIGIITCAHVLEGKQIIHNSIMPSKKYGFEVIYKHDVMDLSIIYVEGMKLEDGLDITKMHNYTLNITDDIYCFGYPNYRIADTGVFRQGKVTGHRVVSTFFKWLVDIPLIGGSSGGPALNKYQQVVGIIVTGADRMENADKTEDHGVLNIKYIYNLLTK